MDVCRALSVGASCSRASGQLRGKGFDAGLRRVKRPIRFHCRASRDAGGIINSRLRGKLVGLGSAGIDYLASVPAYPPPDAKIRTEKLEVQGGGNCGNALTAAARLGLNPALFSKIGGDANGDMILAEFAAEGAKVGEGHR